jgi:glycosyltransferase involved in cell wall biosynthesis
VRPVPDISVVIPTHARAAVIERAVHCALGQTGVDLEVIVVVDGVVDDTRERVEAIGDPRVRTCVLERNQGVANARNHGAGQARAPWLSFLDDDDVWAPGRTRALLDHAGDAGLVTAGTIDVEPSGRVLDRVLPPPGAALRAALFASNAVGGPSSAIVRRSAFEAVGGFDPTFAVLADWDLWLRVLRDHEAAVAPGLLHGYVVHPDAMHLQRTDEALAEFRRLQARHRVAARPGDPDFVDGVYLRWIADVHKRAGRRSEALGMSLRLLARERRWRDLRRALSLALGPRQRRRLERVRPPRHGEAPGWLAAGLGEGPPLRPVAVA